MVARRGSIGSVVVALALSLVLSEANEKAKQGTGGPPGLPQQRAAARFIGVENTY
ncbi:MAG: hypothetical protein ACR2OJ_05285 [Hyphomicrobiales bacterium]